MSPPCALHVPSGQELPSRSYASIVGGGDGGKLHLSQKTILFDTE